MTALRLAVALCFIGAVLLVSSCGDNNADADSGKSRRGLVTVDEEAYMLPPLSAFEEFPAQISTDLIRKASNLDLSMTVIKRTKGDHRQSVYAEFSTPAPDLENREIILSAFTMMGNNFADVARIVLNFPGSNGPRYYVASGRKLNQYLGVGLEDEDEQLTLEEFWSTLEHEVTPENAVEQPTTS